MTHTILGALCIIAVALFLVMGLLLHRLLRCYLHLAAITAQLIEVNRQLSQHGVLSGQLNALVRSARGLNP